MAGKMTLSEGVELQRDLEGSELDVEVELQELEEELKDFRAFPRNLGAVVEGEGLEGLLGLRRRLLESSFRLEGEAMQAYSRLLTRIMQLRCQEYEVGAPISKKDYFRFLACGTPGAELFADTPALHRAYRDIERAEKELLSLKPKQENLLVADLRKLREELKEDGTELAKVARWISTADKAKDRLKQLRLSRGDVSQYLAVENELLRVPLNSREQLQEIASMRKQLEDLTNKVKHFLEFSDSTINYTSPFVEDLLVRYSFLGIRNEYMDRFEGLVTRSRLIFDFAKKPHPDNYARFRKYCEDSPELDNNNDAYRAREATFFTLARVYLDSSDNMIEVATTLLAEGGFLMKYPNRVDAILPCINEIHAKFNKWARDIEQRAEESESEE